MSTPSRDERPDELAAAIRAAFENLPPRYREVLEMKLTLGLSNDDIAARLHRSPAAVRKLTARAIAAIQSQLRDDDSGAGACVLA